MKTNHFIITLIFSLSFSFGALSQSKKKSNLEEAKIAIAKSNSIYFQAFVKNDPSIFINRYAKDCCIMPPDTTAMCGDNAAAEFFRIAFDRIHLRNGKFTTTQVFGNGDDYVTEEGLWESYDTNNQLIDNGKYLVLWKKTNAGWKMFRDSFSSNRGKGNVK